jgi:hypothetical protein
MCWLDTGMASIHLAKTRYWTCGSTPRELTDGVMRPNSSRDAKRAWIKLGDDLFWPTLNQGDGIGEA